MNREIKFRGYNPKNKKWIYGYYFVNRGHHFIVEDRPANPLATPEDYEVVKESIGQFTGFYDDSDDFDFPQKEIYEGDIINVDKFGLREVVYADGSYRIGDIPVYEIVPLVWVVGTAYKPE